MMVDKLSHWIDNIPPNVEDWRGTGGDPSDTGTLQAAAADALPVSLRGSFTIEDTVTLQTGSGFIGAGRGNTALSFVDGAGFYATAKQRIQIRDMSITGDLTESAIGLHFLNCPRGVLLDNLYVYGFGAETGDDGAAVLLDGTGALDMWGSHLSMLMLEGCSRGLVLIRDAATTLSGVVARLNMGDALYAEGSRSMNISGGSFENSFASTGATASVCMHFKDCDTIGALGVYTEGGIDAGIRMDNCRKVEVHAAHIGYIESISGRIVELINGTNHCHVSGDIVNLYNASQTGLYLGADTYNNSAKVIVGHDVFTAGTPFTDLGTDNSLEVTVIT